MEFMIELYVKNATEAIELYTKAFDAKLENIEYTPEKTVLHSEMIALGPVFFSPCMVDFIDKFKVRWCLFAE